MEVKQSRGRVTRFPLIRSLLVLGAISASWFFCNRSTTRGTSVAVEEPVAQPAPPSLPPPPPDRISTRVVRAGDTFSGVMTAMGVSDREAMEYYQPLRSAGLSALYPGDSVIVTAAFDSTFKSLSYFRGMTHRYELCRDAGGLRAEKWMLDRSIHRAVVKGTLESSLSEDLYKHGVGDALVAKIAMILAWDINFFIDPRKGDRFEILFEKEYAEGRFVGYGNILAIKYVNSGHAHWAIGFAGDTGELDYYNLEGRSVQKQFLKAPLRFSRISSGYSYRRRHPILGIVRPHLGIDYAAPRGTPVYAAADGKISFAGTKSGYGRFVSVAHGGAFETYYGHLHAIRHGIRPGTRVRQGDLIGTVGATGLATGPHLDYRMKQHGRFINPLTVRLPSKEAVPEEARAAFAASRDACLFVLSSRFAQDGQYTVDITHPRNDSPAKVVTVALTESADGKRVGSGSDS